MEQIKEEGDLIGKTIKKTGHSDNVFALFFKDGTFAIFRGCGWEERDVDLMSEDFNLSLGRYNIGELREIGFITDIQYSEVFDKHEAEKNTEKEEKEKEEYQRLKLKFEK